ncbi:ergothioneine biosynthesis protein EgtC [Streptomyces aidingensis]|uniref:Gamma-glutamyl-hercynylcysteine sulfoxide hydrolase n=1 Tax=Streptomyces aidingensis TaxID=910347 RepID=A0A1I1R3P5_9ACTN|nr:ergothioneine biosynthesis protein EgtC [Streptomyces aidingensis]SFD28882.1 glutamine amidotransferase [Streptomyces aidingensis]
MCRHLAYLGPPRTLAELITAPPYGLHRQSWAPRRQRHGTVNADGFGIGWYPEPAPPGGPAPEPARYRRSIPLWADGNLPDLARAVRSTAVLAAVRSATAGTSQDEAAAAPFAAGPWLFSHNGAVSRWTDLPADTGWPLSPAALLSLEARCDSALLWAMTLTLLRSGTPAGDALAAVVHATAAVRPDARLNLLLTDGRSIAAVRHGDTLWWRAEPGPGNAVTVASEPDTEDGTGWQEVPDRSLLLATPAGTRVLPPADGPSAAAPPPPPPPSAVLAPGPA